MNTHMHTHRHIAHIHTHIPKKNTNKSLENIRKIYKRNDKVKKNLSINWMGEKRAQSTCIIIMFEILT